MKEKICISIIFGTSAIYDAILGIIGLFFPYFLFTTFDVIPPNHPGYVQFPGALLIVFALMFAAIALNPRANKNLIPYGILLKLCYAGIVFYYWLGPGLPNMWKPFAVADTVFLLLFVWAYMKLLKPAETTA